MGHKRKTRQITLRGVMTGFAVGIILSVTRSLEEAEHETQHAELEAIASETEETPSINNE